MRGGVHERCASPQHTHLLSVRTCSNGSIVSLKHTPHRFERVKKLPWVAAACARVRRAQLRT
jgi:hypothetical protein